MTCLIRGTAHQADTCRFGSDPSSSVVNPDCRLHYGAARWLMQPCI
ncbi:MAG: hypothetical protein HIU92_21060 [Proteobacteria bacterium]|nr:hypothetical protein [Pseudomonadota bacterium]